MITVSTIQSKADLETVFAIRRAVFVVEQNVPADEEYDEFEDTSHHFLAMLDGQPVGTARWRRTSKGIKLERFAVLASARKKGVGKALVQAVLNDVFAQQPEPIESIYLHAQVTAMPLYADFGFVPVGQKFEECNIQHYKMVLPGKRMPGEQMAGPQ
ncbi:GNAT family N-acetyltransferase [Fibrella forsythiae]|uniref:GNAT family N-acetyltransferase n=1 Tax=Fibrella forsythiae TaxID=2817061 RepID=A0ABS3JCC7_9BACT|nr:GNAT family N-acetyltransferase [Fibrella forsythiae]MBO0947643.1 GNAT family N-acetyltransferase [Fibrella forsythiae]